MRSFTLILRLNRSISTPHSLPRSRPRSRGVRAEFINEHRAMYLDWIFADE